MTSKYSPAKIGFSESRPEINQIRTQFKQEAKVVLDYLKNTHHARKLAHMQVHYPDTSEQLGKNRSTPTSDPSSSHVKVESKYHKQGQHSHIQHTYTHTHTLTLILVELERQKEFVSTLQRNIYHEYDINQRKRAYNRSAGTKSIAYDIVKGTTPIPEKEYFFPHNASHNQVLALTGTLSSTDASIIPPAPAPKKQWLGDDQGWSS